MGGLSIKSVGQNNIIKDINNENPEQSNEYYTNHNDNYEDSSNKFKFNFSKIISSKYVYIILIISIIAFTKLTPKIADAESIDVFLQNSSITANDYSDYNKESDSRKNKNSDSFNLSFTEFEIYFAKNLEKYSDDVVIAKAVSSHNTAYITTNKPISIKIKFNKITDGVESISLIADYDATNEAVQIVTKSIIHCFNVKSKFEKSINFNQIEHLETEVIDQNKYIYYNYEESEVLIIEILPL